MPKDVAGPKSLEDRLTEFVQWLADEHDIHLFNAALGPAVVSLDGQQVDSLVSEFVNS